MQSCNQSRVDYIFSLLAPPKAQTRAIEERRSQTRAHALVGGEGKGCSLSHMKHGLLFTIEQPIELNRYPYFYGYRHAVYYTNDLERPDLEPRWKTNSQCEQSGTRKRGSRARFLRFDPGEYPLYRRVTSLFAKFELKTKHSCLLLGFWGNG